MERGALALITGKDPLAAGGHGSYVQAHALAAANIGFEPHLFCLGQRPSVEPTLFGVVHRVAALPRRPPPALLQTPLPAHLPWLARSAAGFLARAGAPSLIHGFSIYAAAGVAAKAMLARRGRRAVALASAYATRAYEIEVMQAGLKPYHGLAHRLRYRAWRQWVHGVDDAVEGWGYARSAVVLVNYASVQRLLLRSYGPLNLRRVPYCSPVAFSSEWLSTPENPAAGVAGLEPRAAPLIVSVSRHDPRKGVDLLLLALHRLQAAGVPFRACLVGPGKLLDVHRCLAARLGLAGQVSLPGAVPDPARYLSSADVFVLPSLGEASGSVSVLEALQAGAPIVASACDGIPEDLTDEVDALLVAPGDVAALTHGLRRLLASRSLRERLGANGRRTYERRFSAAGMVAALGDVYAELESGSAVSKACSE